MHVFKVLNFAGSFAAARKLATAALRAGFRLRFETRCRLIELHSVSDEHPIPQQRDGYGVGREPVVGTRKDADNLAESSALPYAHGQTFLLALARNPKTIFVCWSVDWESVFASGQPADRQVYLRARPESGGPEIVVNAEPLKATATIDVPEAEKRYSVELGFYNPVETWNRIATSDPVDMPPAGAAAASDFEIATIPLHLSFQRMIDIFGNSKSSELTDTIAQLQGRAATAGIESLSDIEQEALRVIEFTQSDADESEKSRASFAASGQHFAHRGEVILGVGATSPGADVFGGS